MNNALPTLSVVVQDDDCPFASASLAAWKDYHYVQITFFGKVFESYINLRTALLPFEVVCTMRARTLTSWSLLTELPKLKVIVSPDAGNAAIDFQAANENSVEVRHTHWSSARSIELTCTLVLSMTRHLPHVATTIRRGLWPTALGQDLGGMTKDVLGFHNIELSVAQLVSFFGMNNVIVSSEGSPKEGADDAVASLFSMGELSAKSRYLTVEMINNFRTKLLVGHAGLPRTKLTSGVFNIAIREICNEAAFIDVLQNKTFTSAAIDLISYSLLIFIHKLRKFSIVICGSALALLFVMALSNGINVVMRNIKDWRRSLMQRQRQYVSVRV